jgi:proteasome lid subunit RPN8/RPN11
VSDYGWSEICDRAVSELVGDVPVPGGARDGWRVRSRTKPLIELGDLSSDWWNSRASCRAARRSVRSRPAAPRRRVVSSAFCVEITETARAAIVRELQRDWDGREQGGALVGHIDGDTVVVEDAGGPGTAPTPRGNDWIKPPLARFLDYARACDCDLVGDWHSHRDSPAASSADKRGWEKARAALRVPAIVGLVVAPERVLALGLRSSQDEVVFSWTTLASTPTSSPSTDANSSR